MFYRSKATFNSVIDDKSLQYIDPKLSFVEQLEVLRYCNFVIENLII